MLNRWYALASSVLLFGCALKDEQNEFAKIRLEIREPYPSIASSVSEASPLGMFSMVPIQSDWYNRATCIGVNILANDIGPDPRFYTDNGGFEQARMDRERTRLGPLMDGSSSCTYPSRFLSAPIQLPLAGGSAALDFQIPKGTRRLFQIGAFYDPQRLDYCGGFAGTGGGGGKGMKIFEVGRAIKDVFRDEDVSLVNSYPTSYLGAMRRDMSCDDAEILDLQKNNDGTSSLIAWYQADRYEEALQNPGNTGVPLSVAQKFFPTAGVFGDLTPSTTPSPSPTYIGYSGTGSAPDVRALRVGRSASNDFGLIKVMAAQPSISDLTFAVAFRAKGGTLDQTFLVSLCDTPECASGGTPDGRLKMAVESGNQISIRGEHSTNAPYFPAAPIATSGPTLVAGDVVVVIATASFGVASPIPSTILAFSRTGSWTSGSQTANTNMPTLEPIYFMIGGSNTASQSNDILEVMVFSKALQNYQLTKLKDYLQTKYQF